MCSRFSLFREMQGMCDYSFFKVKEKRDYEGSERT